MIWWISIQQISQAEEPTAQRSETTMQPNATSNLGADATLDFIFNWVE